jgi:ribonuclease R
MVEFMLDKIGMEFDGIVSGVTEWGIYVEIKENKVEGMVSTRDLTDDIYIFDEDSYSLVGKNRGRSFTLGDEVRIRVLRANLSRKQLDYELVGRNGEPLSFEPSAQPIESVGRFTSPRSSRSSGRRTGEKKSHGGGRKSSSKPKGRRSH